MIKRILGRLLPKAYKKQLINFNILSSKYGQFNTIKNWDCIDKYGNEIPWYTYPSIEYLSNIDFSEKKIFEYGSGNSSKYWSNKSKHVTSVEHDDIWYNKVKLKLNNNQKLLFKKDFHEYEETIKIEDEKYDVIIIDGIRRVECSKVIKKYLNNNSTEGSMIILDNSDWYKDTAKYLRENLDFIEIDFHGFGAINSYTWTTSIFLSRNFNFKPIDNIQPNFSISAIEQSGE